MQSFSCLMAAGVRSRIEIPQIGVLRMKRRILLVDDEPAILLTLKAVLELHDFEVDTAATAREARSRIRTQQFHMVITDMRMESETAGLDVVKAAKAAPYQPAVAMLTAFPFADGELHQAGTDKMLVKPMNIKDLVLQIEALLVSHEDKKRKALDLAASQKPVTKQTARKSEAKTGAKKVIAAAKNA
jgi:DNA-binding response OmpR family regulator